jgi:hypothetical protein
MKTISVPRWMGSASLDLVYQLNEQCLELLVWAAAQGEIGALSVLRRHQKFWRQLDAAARQRAARLPVVLVNVHFNDAPWWQALRSRIGENRLAVDRPDGPALLGGAFIGEVLNHIWHVAHGDARLASLTFGLCPKVAAIMGEMEMREVRAAGALHGLEQWLRWKDSLRLWNRLLFAAVHGNRKLLSAVHLQAQLLSCGDLLSTRNPS